MLKIQEIIDDIRVRYPNVYSDNQIIKWINNIVEEVWEDLAFSEIWRCQLEAGISTYKLPDDMDFSAIFAVVVNDKEYDARALPDFKGQNNYFKLAEGTISINPTPSSEGEMYIYYLKKPTKAQETSDELEIRPQFAELVKNGVFVIMAKAAGEAQLANNYVAVYNAALEHALARKALYSSAYPKVREAQRVWR